MSNGFLYDLTAVLLFLFLLLKMGGRPDSELAPLTGESCCRVMGLRDQCTLRYSSHSPLDFFTFSTPLFATLSNAFLLSVCRFLSFTGLASLFMTLIPYLSLSLSSRWGYVLINTLPIQPSVLLGHRNLHGGREVSGVGLLVHIIPDVEHPQRWMTEVFKTVGGLLCLEWQRVGCSKSIGTVWGDCPVDIRVCFSRWTSLGTVMASSLALLRYLLYIQGWRARLDAWMLGGYCMARRFEVCC